ncbi:MAG: hypothetical protein GY804_03955 [Alphaproteobacteria bacterium]|nr:hypothetical protein [Alphaproteobacteria bacterium]
MGAAQKKVSSISQAVGRKLNQQMLEHVRNKSCLGNSERELKHLVQDLLNERCSGDKDYAIVADQAWLMASTVRRVAHQDREEDYQPRADTLQRLLKVLDVRLVAEYQKVNKKYLPNAKRPELEDSYGD